MDGNKKEGKAAVKGNEEEENKEQREEISENSSSIGVDSDEGKMGIDEEGDGGSSEVQSSAFGGLSSLKNLLPMKRGLSEYYVGREKSYTNLAEACGSESVKDIAKPGDAYKERRRNEMARNIMLSSKSLKTNAGGGIRTGGEMSSLDTPTITNQTSPGGNTENLASSASQPMYRVPLHLRVSHESSSSPSRNASTFTPGRSLLSHESSSSPSRNATTFTPVRSSSSFADLHGVAAADEINSRLRVDSSSTSFQSATATAASDNTRRPDNLESAVADDGSDPHRRLNNSTTSSNKGVDTKEPQK